MVRPTRLRLPARDNYLNFDAQKSGDRDSPPSARGRMPPTSPVINLCGQLSPSMLGLPVTVAAGSGIGVRGCCAGTISPGHRSLPIPEGARPVGIRPEAPERA